MRAYLLAWAALWTGCSCTKDTGGGGLAPDEARIRITVVHASDLEVDQYRVEIVLPGGEAADLEQDLFPEKAGDPIASGETIEITLGGVTAKTPVRVVVTGRRSNSEVADGEEDVTLVPGEVVEVEVCVGDCAGGEGECETDEDCDAMGDPPCPGTWACTDGECQALCPMCDDLDFDGYGDGDGCAGPDCDDGDQDRNPGEVETCNTIDDDCDFDVDDGDNDCGGVCTLAAAPGDACDGDDTDDCAEGTFACDGLNALACDDTDDDDVETCNDADDDCDGMSDDGLDPVACPCAPGGAGSTAESCNQIDDDCDGTADDGLDPGVCPCAPGGIGPTTEACNLVDDDCNDAVDDGIAPPSACDGADADACEEGVLVCTGGAFVCDDATGDNVETCDGTDEDCDGTPDDGIASLGPCDGADTDLCDEGTVACAGALGFVCDDATGDSVETCDGLDNDCNGTDDDLPPVSCGIGLCATSVVPCSGGTIVACTPLPGSSEACDGLDNDCDGAIDEISSCACAFVSPAGDDSNPGTGSSPLRTINAGITAAAAAGYTRVCVASGTSCPSTETYDEDVTMLDGISVEGQYDDNGGSAWTRSSSCDTEIDDLDSDGVYFGSYVTSPTALDGFDVFSDGLAAITVDGSTGAVLSNLRVYGSDDATSYGVQVVNGGAPTITRSYVEGGLGTTLSVGVYSLDSAPIIVDNCDSFSGSRCTDGCANRGSFFDLRDSIMGHPDTCCSPVPAYPGDSVAVWLEDSPGAQVTRNAMCGAWGDQAAGVRIVGDATGTVVQGSNIASWGATVFAYGVWIDPCAGASPWIGDNEFIGGTSDAAGVLGDGVNVLGDCHPVIEANAWIVGGMEGAVSDVNGVYCRTDAGSGIASQCVVANNEEIRGTSGGFPPTSTGVRCDGGACARIEGNWEIWGLQGVDAFGIVLGHDAAPLVANNYVLGGCATSDAVGIYALDAASRIENNRVFAGSCNVGAVSGATFYALRYNQGTGAGEIDAHSNTIVGDGDTIGCTAYAVAIEVMGGGPPAPKGIFRNNILQAGNCPTRYDLAELAAAGDPGIVENNDFYLTGSGTLYLDEATSALTTISAVNALTDITVSANVSGSPTFTSYPSDLHIGSSSVCRNAGTTTGAPAVDMDGDARPQESAPDCGADEFVP